MAQPVQFKVYDRKLGIMYNRGKFLGKVSFLFNEFTYSFIVCLCNICIYVLQGGFGICYEFINTKNNEVYAAKVLSKSEMHKVTAKDSLITEVEIHKELKHPNVVRIFGHFEDDRNVYIILEMCKYKVGIVLAITDCIAVIKPRAHANQVNS